MTRWLKFSEQLRQAMDELGVNQSQLVGMTGKSKGSISQYLSDQQEPSEQTKSEIAVALGLDADYFSQDLAIEQEAAAIFGKPADYEGNIEQLRVCEVAKIMHKHTDTIRYGLQQGVFPWGYAISTKNGRWSYFINKKRFEEIEGVTLSRGQA